MGHIRQNTERSSSTKTKTCSHASIIDIVDWGFHVPATQYKCFRETRPDEGHLGHRPSPLMIIVSHQTSYLRPGS